MATAFSVAPRLVRAPSLPTVRFRVDEPGVRRVDVRVSLVPLRGEGRALTVALGWQATGHRITARWSRGARLVAGRYQVRLDARDPRGHALLRRARASGSAALTVLAPRPPAPPPAPRTAFPVQGPHAYGDGFGAPRPGHLHQGQDVAAAEGTPLVAPTAGTISQASVQPAGAGWYLVEHSVDGRDFFFAHCQAGSFAVTAGSAVRAGQQLCRVGSTGDASGPHLHFEIWVGGWRTGAGRPIDPLAQLRAWER